MLIVISEKAECFERSKQNTSSLHSRELKRRELTPLIRVHKVRLTSLQYFLPIISSDCDQLCWDATQRQCDSRFLHWLKLTASARVIESFESRKISLFLRDLLPTNE